MVLSVLEMIHLLYPADRRWLNLDRILGRASPFFLLLKFPKPGAQELD
jgi:hypothetical protein